MYFWSVLTRLQLVTKFFAEITPALGYLCVWIWSAGIWIEKYIILFGIHWWQSILLSELINDLSPTNEEISRIAWHFSWLTRFRSSDVDGGLIKFEALATGCLVLCLRKPQRLPI